MPGPAGLLRAVPRGNRNRPALCPRPGQLTVMVNEPLTFLAGTPLSFTFTMKLEVEAVEDGVPEIVPDVLFNVSPAGRVPLNTFHV